jgi:hypothetical protein
MASGIAMARTLEAEKPMRTHRQEKSLSTTVSRSPRRRDRFRTRARNRTRCAWSRGKAATASTRRWQLNAMAWAADVSATPVGPEASWSLMLITSAVIVPVTTAPIQGPIGAIQPSPIGSAVGTAECTAAAESIPASFANTARRQPGRRARHRQRRHRCRHRRWPGGRPSRSGRHWRWRSKARSRGRVWPSRARPSRGHAIDSMPPVTTMPPTEARTRPKSRPWSAKKVVAAAGDIDDLPKGLVRPKPVGATHAANGKADREQAAAPWSAHLVEPLRRRPRRCRPGLRCASSRRVHQV